MADPTPAVRRSLFLHGPNRRKPRMMLESMLELVDDDTPADGPDGPVAPSPPTRSRIWTCGRSRATTPSTACGCAAPATRTS